MRKAHFGLIALPLNLKDHVGTNPLVFVFDKVEVIVQHMPDHFLAGHEFGNLETAAVYVLVVVMKLSTGPVCITLNGLRPPAPHVVNRVEDFFR